LVLAAIMDHFTSDAPLFDQPWPPRDADGGGAEIILDEISRQIIDLIDKRVRPAVARDGGDIAFDSFQNGVVFVRLHGACAGCPSSTKTLKMGVENLLRHYVPEVIEVRAVAH
jgi:Fe-S cluster biogenesis protein NfuA